ncbi:hypothetical protein ACFQ07_04680, partial [Actinomadura adrarensis]
MGTCRVQGGNASSRPGNSCSTSRSSLVVPMTSVLSTVIIVASLLAALYALIGALRDRPMDWWDVGALGVLEALLIAQ